MLIGVPGSGKSTWMEEMIESSEKVPYIVSTDDIIELIAAQSGQTYNDVFKDNIKAAEKIMYKGAASAVAEDHDIIRDQTNLTRKSRAKKLIMIPDHYIKIAQFFPVPEKEELERRLASRLGKTIPAGILQNMIDTIEFPSLDEGFHQIVSHGECVL